jgi:PAS domain S-box-containing protein
MTNVRRVPNVHADDSSHKPHPRAADAMREIAAHALDAVVTMEPSGAITGWNDRAEHMFGWKARDVLGRPMDEVIIPERYREAHRAGLERYRATGTGPLLDTRTAISALHRDGTEFPIEVSITALVEEEAGVTFVGFLRDHTTQRRLEEALRDSEERFTSVIEQLPGIAYANGIGGTGVYVSPKVDDILGYTADEWLTDGDLWIRALHPDDRQRTVDARREGEASGGSFSSVYRLIARDGRTVWIRDQATVHRDVDGELRVSGVMFDITHERGVEAELELAVAERAAIAASLRRVTGGRPTAETAEAICRELARIPHLDVAVVLEFAHDGSVTPLGQHTPPGVPVTVGRPLPPREAQYLRESATGPWIDDWRPRPAVDAYSRQWHEVGLSCAVYVPFGADGITFGLLLAGTTAPIGAPGVSRWMPSLSEFGTIAAALLVPELSARREEAGTRAEMQRIVSGGELATVFQQVVRIGDGSIVGYEALTRFADETPPDRRFAIAESVGAGAELERAAVRSAIAGAAHLPTGPWLSVNLSPSRLTEPGIIDLLRSGSRGRPLVIEITERLAVDDYDAVRATLDELAGFIEVAVDDAGAGFASLRHILELRPRYVKLDMQLVRGVDSDPARQALIAGMVYFARQSGCLLVAEGVQSEPERAVLHRLGVPLGQGYLFGRPMPARAEGKRPVIGKLRRAAKPERAFG